MNKYSVMEHRLLKDGNPVSWKRSPNCGGIIEPELIVIHYTGDNGTGGLQWLTTKGSGVSAHLWISKGGVDWQLLPFNVRAWHAGRSEWDGRSDCNNFSVGIECQGVGGDWPESQVKAIIGVCEALHEAYPIYGIAGHDEVAIPAGRKSDPGPHFPWQRVYEELGYD
jgi:N-acetyl-anhydromuramyl-L-alanine amidase AmpD